MIKKLVSLVLIASVLCTDSPTAIGQKGVVTSSSRYASDVGIEILRQGGNAVDAAVAVGFALSVVFPNAGNLGGGGFMVIRTADGEVTTIDFREVAPGEARRDMFLDNNGDVVPGMSLYTSRSSGVPGTVAGLGYAHEKYGSLAWPTLVSPARLLAFHGFSLTQRDASYLNSAKAYLAHDPETAKIFTSDSLFKTGEIFVQRDLANTLARIEVFGAEDFYTGSRIPAMIEDCMHRTGGIITSEDLEGYRVIEREPVTFDYRGNTVYSMPPASSGGVCLAEILNQVETLPMWEYKFKSLEHIQAMVEAERRAYADRAEYLGDMDFVSIPLDELTSDGYAVSRFSDYDMDNIISSDDMGPGEVSVLHESEETTHYSIVDRWGNAVSVTTTLNGKYGNGIVVDGAGFLLNNEMDDFAIKPGHPNKYGLVGSEANSIYAGKRMLSSMSPTIVEDAGGELFLVLGSPGGSTIITTVAQIIVNVVDFGMDIDDAVAATRFHHQWLPDAIFFESGTLSQSLKKDLRSKGYTLKEKKSIGEANCIQILERGIKFGVADSRRSASASAY